MVQILWVKEVTWSRFVLSPCSLSTYCGRELGQVLWPLRELTWEECSLVGGKACKQRTITNCLTCTEAKGGAANLDLAASCLDVLRQVA